MKGCVFMQNNTKKLSLSAVMLALATVLSLVKIFELPNSGSITAASMLPVIIVSYLYDFKWSLFVAFTYSLLQMLCGFFPPPTRDVFSFFAVIMLDYVLAFTVLGAAGQLSKKIKNVKIKYTAGAAAVIFARFICHLISGIIIWKVYAPEGQSPFVYSLLYNGSFMGIEFIITVILIFFLSERIEKLKNSF